MAPISRVPTELDPLEDPDRKSARPCTEDEREIPGDARSRFKIRKGASAEGPGGPRPGLGADAGADPCGDQPLVQGLEERDGADEPAMLLVVEGSRTSA